MNELVAVALAADAVALTLGGAVARLAYRASRRDRGTGLGLVAAGFGLAALGLLLGGVLLVLGSGAPAVAAVQGVLVAAGFCLVGRALYGGDRTADAPR